eukprot:m.1180739 g.1180739  ORF g.1180739 m.1180739 type:complete len:97 (-) comp24532_c0_seq64:662-952(-)
MLQSYITPVQERLIPQMESRSAADILQDHCFAKWMCIDTTLELISHKQLVLSMHLRRHIFVTKTTYVSSNGQHGISERLQCIGTRDNVAEESVQPR